MADQALILVGAVVGAFGVKGEVKVRAFTAAPDGVCHYGPLYDKAGRIVLTPRSWRPIKDGLAVLAPEVKDREAAEALRNTGLHVPRGLFSPPDEDEFYHVDLIGCHVEALDGTALGDVTAVVNFGAGDLLDVSLDGRHQFYPFTKAAAPIVDIAARRIVVDPPIVDDEDPTA